VVCNELNERREERDWFLPNSTGPWLLIIHTPYSLVSKLCDLNCRKGEEKRIKPESVRSGSGYYKQRGTIIAYNGWPY